MPLTRREACRLGLAGAAALTASLVGCGTGRYTGPDRTIRIAGGQHGGVYVKIAELLAREITVAEPRLRCSALETDGSVTNVRMLRDGTADIAMCQSDIALAAVAGTEPFGEAAPVQGVGRMYEDYVQLAVLTDSPVRSVTDLAGRTVSLGAVGSGTAIVGKRLMATAGIQVVGRFESLDAAVAGLRARRVDAVVWCGGVPSPALAELDGDVGIRLLPLASMLRALRTRHGTAYQQVNIPAGGYGQSGMPTIGVSNLLLCRQNLPADVATAITCVLVERATQLVPPQALSAQFLDQRTLIGLLGIPMHPGAASAYRQLHG